jgi:RNA polymerase primary sigma factor
VRLPLNKVGSLNKINKAFSQLEQQYEREPTSEELAALLDVSDDEVRATISVASRHLSMDAPFQEGEDGSLVDVLKNPNAVNTDRDVEHIESLRKEIERSLTLLTERQSEVLRLFFGIGVNQPVSLEDIADRFNLTRERVRQIKDKAITKLRSTNRSKVLKTYLGE